MNEASLTKRFTVIEHQLKVISDHLGIDCPPFPGLLAGMSKGEAEDPFMDEVRELKRNGKTIHAIKLLRERTGLGLVEAKNAVDRL